MAQHGHLTREEKKVIRQKRRVLRADLKKRGITSKAEFETIAQQLGLVYGNGKGLLLWWWRFLDALGSTGLAIIAALIVASLVVLFGYAALNRKKQDFTISLSDLMQNIGFDLSETEDFKDPQTRLTAAKPEDVNCISIVDIPTDLDNYEGSHNGDNYMAYTFWIRNHGEITVGYEWDLLLKSVKNNIDEALWIVIYDEGKHIIYSKAPAGHKNEKLAGYEEFPLYENSADPNDQFYEGAHGKGIKARAYADPENRIVANGVVEEFEPEEKHKYTVVMWMEGDDPECDNKTLGGSIAYNFKFSVILPEDMDESVFDQINTDKEQDIIEEMGKEEQERLKDRNLR